MKKLYIISEEELYNLLLNMKEDIIDLSIKVDCSDLEYFEIKLDDIINNRFDIKL